MIQIQILRVTNLKYAKQFLIHIKSDMIHTDNTESVHESNLFVIKLHWLYLFLSVTSNDDANRNRIALPLFCCTVAFYLITSNSDYKLTIQVKCCGAVEPLQLCREPLVALFSRRNNLFLCAGHEAAFAAFLCCLCKVGALRIEDQLAIIFKVFDTLVHLIA